ncbi:MAG TPA: hypothetical protein VF478_07100 [Anaerolineae bacterium]
MSADFYGLPTRTIGTKYLHIDYLAEAGPRIVRLVLEGSNENLMAELPNNVVQTPFGVFHFYGGHRLWHSPEEMPRTYFPDSNGVIVEDLTDGVRLVQPTAEPHTGMRKSIEIHLHSDHAALTLVHRLQNEGTQTVEFAPWAITQVKQGGVAILPQTVGPVDTAGLLANRHLVLWPYTSWHDPRLELNDDLILIDAQPKLPPCKIGYLNRHGWMGYLRKGMLFVKRFEAQLDRAHPDYGCNAEIYCNDQFIELETLGPLVKLQPGDSTTSKETWEFYTGLGESQTIEAVRSHLDRLKLT